MKSKSYIATPPGATIKEQLGDRSMSQKEFAARMNMSEKHISKLINGEVQLTFEMAVRLEMVLGLPAGFWNNLEAIYREKLIKAEAENAVDADAELARELPYNEMAKLGWVPAAGNITEKVINLRKYFEVVDLSLLESSQITRIACRRLKITESGDFALMAWAQKVKLTARNMETAPINLKRLKSYIMEIREMTIQTPDVFLIKLEKLLADCGIAFVSLTHLKGSFLQGATFMDGNRIVIGLTTRGKDADRFWFSLFHELGHILLGHVGKAEGTSEQDEQDADQWSTEELIPKTEFEKFTNGNSYDKESICKFADEIGTAPGIVVGRLQKEGYIRHNRMNDLKEHYEITV